MKPNYIVKITEQVGLQWLLVCEQISVLVSCIWMSSIMEVSLYGAHLLTFATLGACKIKDQFQMSIIGRFHSMTN